MLPVSFYKSIIRNNIIFYIESLWISDRQHRLAGSHNTYCADVSFGTTHLTGSGQHALTIDRGSWVIYGHSGFMLWTASTITILSSPVHPDIVWNYYWINLINSGHVSRIDKWLSVHILTNGANQYPKYILLVRWLCGSYLPNVSEMLNQTFITVLWLTLTSIRSKTL